MTRCQYCGTTILFGGALEGDLRFCNDQCHKAGRLLTSSQRIPDNVVQQKLWNVHQGNCPICKGRGPIDVHMSYRVCSAGIVTHWSSRPVMRLPLEKRQELLTDALVKLKYPVLRSNSFDAKPADLIRAAKE